ncbi:MAG: PAS domain S-box protein [Verrucomicrobia bacterium]|nr:PAS domain S-box protein [Verrucomicrobiota bacterium]
MKTSDSLTPLRALIVEDNESDAQLLLRALRQAGFAVTSERVETAGALKEALGRRDWEIVFSDFSLPEFDGMAALKVVLASGQDLPFILVSGAVGEEVAVEAMRAGAHDFFVKGRLARLGSAVARELREAAHRRAHYEAEEQVQRLSQAVRQAPVSLMITDVAGNIQYVNPKFTELTGYSAAEAVGRNPRFLQSGLTPRQVYEELWRTITAGREWRGELCNRKKSGELFWENASITPIRDGGEEIGGFLAVKLDITAEKRTAEALRQSEERFRQIAATTADWFWETDPDGLYTMASPTVVKILGYTAEEIVGRKHFYDLLDPEVCEKVKQVTFAAYERKEDLRNLENANRHKDGSLVLLETNGVPILDEKGTLLGYRGADTDITARKQAEDKLREQAALLDQASDAIYVYTPDGTVRYWSRGAERLYGWTRAEIVGHKLTEFNLRDSDKPDEIAEALAQTGGWCGEKRRLSRNGKEVTVFCRLTAASDAQGTPTVIIIDTDITEKKQIEARFLHAQRLENLGALASGLAHDLNNVLAPVLMATGILKNRMPEEGDRRMIATMEASAQRGSNIVRQVLSFARGIKGERVPVSIRHLLREMADIATETFPPTIEVEMEAPKDLWSVLADATQLHQVLMNICVNARDAMPQGGTLSLRAENREIDEAYAAMTPGAQPGPHVCVTVTDTGVGIAPEHRTKIFDPFFTTKGPGSGTGLGLATALGLIRNHGGFLQVDSTVGRGTSFAVFLPAAIDVTAIEERPAPPQFARGQGQTILVVDDEPAICTVTSHILDHHGYRPLCASDGVEAMALFVRETGGIAAVLTDMVMPAMDGPTLARTLRRINPRLPIIGMTGFPEKERLANAGNLGLPTVLAKPFTTEQLMRALHAALHAPPGGEAIVSASLETSPAVAST